MANVMKQKKAKNCHEYRFVCTANTKANTKIDINKINTVPILNWPFNCSYSFAHSQKLHTKPNFHYPISYLYCLPFDRARTLWFTYIYLEHLYDEKAKNWLFCAYFGVCRCLWRATKRIIPSLFTLKNALNYRTMWNSIHNKFITRAVEKTSLNYPKTMYTHTPTI